VPERGRRFRRFVPLIVSAVALIAASMIIPEWIPRLPRPVRRSLTEGLLGAVLVGYGGLLLLSFVAAPVMAFLLFKSHRARRSRPLLARGVLLGGSCFFALLLLELGSAGWRLWMHRYPELPMSFPAEAADEFRIVVVGGSSAAGEPYRPWISVGQIVAWRLGQAMPERRFECEIVAELGDSLEDQHRRLAALKRRPNMVIIYSGHNEFTARYEEEREGWLDEEPGSPLFQAFYRASRYSPLCRLASEMISKNRLDRGPPMYDRHQLIDPPQCSPAEAEAIYEDFEGRLEALAAYCERIGAAPVLIVPPANEADFEPSRSTLPPRVSQQERSSLLQKFTAARASESSDPEAGAKLYQQILDRHPGFAEAHFRLARLQERAGRHEEAAGHYLAALENDGLPIRCRAPLRSAYTRIAARHPRSILIDGRAELARASPRKLLDDHVIQDAHHPTLRGQVALAQAVLRELARKKVLGGSYPVEAPLEPADCADHFEMNALKWAILCEQTSRHYRRVAEYRYDPTERLEKSRRYAQAARRIMAGLAPERTGVLGVGVERADRQEPEGFESDRRPRGVNKNAAGTRVADTRGESRAPSFGDSLDLPILEQDRRTTSQEPDGCHKVISVGAFDHFPGEAPERPVQDAHRGADRDRGLFRDNEARGDHGVDLMEVASQTILIGDVEDSCNPVSAESGESILLSPFQEHVAWKEGYNRLDPPSLRSAAFFSRLRKVVGDTRFAKLAGSRLLLARLGVQAPPDQAVRQGR
jgi:hypothetical protein